MILRCGKYFFGNLRVSPESPIVSQISNVVTSKNFTGYPSKDLKMEKAKRKKYSEEALRNALAAVNSGRTIRSVSITYGIPKTTLLYKHKGKLPIGKNMGPPPVLSEDEEKKLVEWMIHVSDRGFPITKTQLINSVELLIKQLKKVTPFKDGRPGRHWYEGFVRRHPEISERFRRNGGTSSSSSSTEEDCAREWYAKIEQYLKNGHLVDIDKSRIFNCDEIAFFLNPKNDNVLIKKGDKTVHNFIAYDENECLTTLFMTSASGILAPPMVVLCYERIPYSVSQSIHESWGIGKSENGWMTGETFYDYIVNVFEPWLSNNEIERPIVLYIDGRSSYLTMALDEFCRNRGIELVALYPNACHIMQPLDLTFFQPLKEAWCMATRQWHMENDEKRLRKENFASILVQALSTIDIGEIIPMGFKLSGLHPFSADAINNTKIFKLEAKAAKEAANNSGSVTGSNKEFNKKNKEIMKHLKFMEQHVDESTLMGFRDAEIIGKWYGDIRDENLFLFWLKLRKLANNET